MDESSTIQWKYFCVDRYDKGTFLLGLNFNTNNEYYRQREIYLVIYLGKFSVTIGKFV